MRLLCALLLYACISIPLSSGDAATWQVPTDAQTIQAGIDSASAGDTVVVECGTYYEHDVEMKSGVVLRSETRESDCVTIHAESQGCVIHCQGVDSTAALEGFTLRGGSADAYGGGLQCHAGSSPRVTDCAFVNNWGTHGGAVGCQASSSPTFTRCVFHSNSATDAGGAAIFSISCSPILRHCTFSGNSGVRGGGIYCEIDSYPVLENTIIAFSEQGQAVYCIETSIPSLTCCDIVGNAGGDWIGCIADQYGADGNISEDPLFCDPDNGDFSISEYSPCGPGHSGCGLIGADSVGCSLTLVAEREQQAPMALYLGPAVPNPFNPITEIRYGIPPNDGPPLVTMSVYDARGRRVRTLVDADRGPGIHTVIWDGTDLKGVPVASGVYFYRLTWNGKSETKRMVLLK